MEIMDWAHAGLPDYANAVIIDNRNSITIRTPQGPMFAVPGDYVIREAGYFYPCKPRIFETTYEEAT